ncbi:thioesterase family protein [Streptomyces sp. NPDC046261]|uniref:acyl-CoA thioesterase n=1 Tax=Streptomyces sp. NPDC046261 TaxID=3157200 RepID=UPI0033D6E151
MRWSDVNACGMVGDAALASCVDEARAAFCLRLADLSAAPSGRRWSDYALLTTRQHIDFLHPLRWRSEPVEVSLQVLRVRPAVTELLAEVTDAVRTYASARVTSVFWDVRRSRPYLLTPAQHRLLAEHALPGAPAPPRRTC